MSEDTNVGGPVENSPLVIQWGSQKIALIFPPILLSSTKSIELASGYIENYFPLITVYWPWGWGVPAIICVCV